MSTFFIELLRDGLGVVSRVVNSLQGPCTTATSNRNALGRRILWPVRADRARFRCARTRRKCQRSRQVVLRHLTQSSRKSAMSEPLAPPDEVLRELLASRPVIALVGASVRSRRPSHGVMASL